MTISKQEPNNKNRNSKQDKSECLEIKVLKIGIYLDFCDLHFGIFLSSSHYLLKSGIIFKIVLLQPNGKGENKCLEFKLKPS